MKPGPFATAEQRIERKIEELMLHREAQGLRWSSTARTVAIGVGIGIEAANAEAWFNAAIMGAFVAFSAWHFVFTLRAAQRAEKRPTEMRFAGAIGVGFDVTFLLTMPIVWYLAVGGTSTNPAFLVRNDQAITMIVMMVYNTLVLRAAYPGVIATVGVAQLVGFAVYASFDPRAELTDSNVVAVLGAGVKPGFYAWRVAAVAFCGLFLSRLARWGRKTVRDVVELEGEAFLFAERQMEAIRHAKNEATASLVAGVAHEFNTPLGALASCTGTALKVGRQMYESIAGANGVDELRKHRAYDLWPKILTDTEATSATARERLEHVIDGLKSFSQLDRAERARVDLAAALRDAVGLTDPALRGSVTISDELGELPPTEVHAASLNQVLMTLIEHSLRRSRGAGTITLRGRHENGSVFLEVVDDGPSLSDEECDQLFDMGLSAKARRVGVDFALAAARHAVEAHGGTLVAVSAERAGATFRIALPAS